MVCEADEQEPYDRCARRIAYTAALSAGIHASQKKNATSMNMEMINGAKTRAEDHPLSEPLVMANMKRMSATGSARS